MGNVIFDPDLYQRAQEESRFLLQNMIAPPGPPPGPAVEKKPSAATPVTINIGEPKFNPQVEGPNIWQTLAKKFGEGPSEWYPPWMAEAGGPIPRAAIGSFPTERPTGGGGFVAPPWTGPRPWRATPPAMSQGPLERPASQIINMVPSPEGTYQIEGGPIKPMSADYWQMPGRGSFNVIPGYRGPTYPTPEQMELGARERWEGLGYYEKALQAARERAGPGSNVIGLTPGYQRSYYEAHPEERIMDMLTEQQKPYMDMMNKIIEQNRTWAQGYGLPAGEQGKLVQAQAVKNLEGLVRTIPAMGQIIPSASEKMMENLPGSPKSQYQLAQAQAAWAGIPIRQTEAETHRFAAEELSKHYGAPVQIAPGGTLTTKEGKVLFKSDLKPENTAGLWGDWLKFSFDEDMFGRKKFNPIKSVWGYNMMFANQPGFQSKTIKDFDQTMVAPFIQEYIQTNPKTSNLKQGSKEYQKLFEETMKELYK